jgi:hypothetical protein
MKPLVFLAAGILAFAFSMPLAFAQSGAWTFQGTAFERQVANKDKWHYVTCKNSKSGATVNRTIIEDFKGRWDVYIDGSMKRPDIDVPDKSSPETAGKKFCSRLYDSGKYPGEDGTSARTTFFKISIDKDGKNEARYMLLCKFKDYPKEPPKEIPVFKKKTTGEWEVNVNWSGPREKVKIAGTASPNAVGKEVCNGLVYLGGGFEYGE